MALVQVNEREPGGSDRNRGGRPAPTASVGWVERSETHHGSTNRTRLSPVRKALRDAASKLGPAGRAGGLWR
jgi:hypothetical protein